MTHPHVDDARKILISLGLPRAQQNERSALSLLALLDLRPKRRWAGAQNPLIGITPMMDWIREHYKKTYAPNTRETVRRQTMHQFVAAGIALYNPDKPDRPVNSPAAVYQIEPSALALLRGFDKKTWSAKLAGYLAKRQTLAARYAHERKQNLIPVEIAPGKEITLSPGEHSELIRAIVEDFGKRFVPGGVLIYAGDTGEKWGYFDAVLLSKLGVSVDAHGKMPDVVLHYPERNWLLLIESVTSHGPVDGKRHAELARLFAKATAGLGLRDRVPQPRHHEPLSRRDCMGNGGMGSRRSFAPDSLQRRAVFRPLLTGHQWCLTAHPSQRLNELDEDAIGQDVDSRRQGSGRAGGRRKQHARRDAAGNYRCGHRNRSRRSGVNQRRGHQRGRARRDFPRGLYRRVVK